MSARRDLRTLRGIDMAAELSTALMAEQQNAARLKQPARHWCGLYGSGAERAHLPCGGTSSARC